MNTPVNAVNIPVPPAPRKGYTTYYDHHAGKWMQVKIVRN